MKGHTSFIHNRYLDANGAVTSKVYNPYTNLCIKELYNLQVNEVTELIKSTNKAFQAYRKTNKGERAQLLERIYISVESNKSQFINYFVEEAGKPISYARLEIERCLQTIQCGIQSCYKTQDEIIPMDFAQGLGRKAFTMQVPAGPVLAFSPFNFPLNLALHKIIPALVAGNSIVLKAPPQAPSAALLFAELVAQAGAPEGLVNVIICTNELAGDLVENPAFAIFSFTGSSEVAWMLHSRAGKKKTILEGGGNAAVIIDKNTDIDAIAKRVAYGSFVYAGQICISTQRIYVVSEIAHEFEHAFISATLQIQSGNPALQETINGPLIHANAINKLEKHLSQAQKDGAKLLIGGNILQGHNQVFEPTIITSTKPNMSVVTDELFAPVAVLETVKDFHEGIQAANHSRYGLQCGVFTNDLRKMKDAMQEIEAGAIIFNDIPGFRMDHMPYGGVKDSGTGREGIDFAIKAYTESKLIIF